MSRHYDGDGRCRYCRRYDGEHKSSCVLAPVPPEVDEPAVEDELVNVADSRYADGLFGEPGGWR